MHKKLISIILISMMLMPNAVFAESINTQEQAELQTEQNTPESQLEEPNQTAEEPQPEKPQELAPSIIKNIKVEALDTAHCKVTWECAEKVNITYSYDGFTSTVTTSSKYFDCTEIPFGETVSFVLTTDEEHEPVEVKCNPSEDMTPVQITGEDSFVISNDTKKLQSYGNWKVVAKNGRNISSANYTLDNVSVNEPGIYTLKATFTGEYEKYAPMLKEIQIRPFRPLIGYNYFNPVNNAIEFWVCNYKAGKTLMVEISEKSDFSNPIKKTFTIKDSEKHRISGLKTNAKYYFRARFVKTAEGKSIYSDYAGEPMYTATPVPEYSTNQKDIKNIVALMKENKSFTYKFKGHYDISKMFAFLHDLPCDYPQYADRYTRDVDFEKDSFTVKYTIDKANFNKAVKTEKVINSIVKKAKKKKGARAKIKYVNTRMCNLCRYDYDTYRRTKKYSTDAYTAYGCLVRHKAVCSGYAEAFRAIMVQLGIPNTYANGHNHRWNKVKIGKKWYHVDVTWNDTGGRRTKYLLKKSHR